MQIVFLEKKNIADTTNIDQWSPTFTFFDWSRVQKDALFKALISETVYRDPTNYSLLGSQKHITLNIRLGPIMECPPPSPHSPGHTRVFCPTCIHSMWGKSLIWAKAKMQSNKKKNWGKLIKISITFFFFKNSIIYGHIREYPGPRGFLKIFLFLSPLATLRLALSFPKKNFKKNTWDQGKPGVADERRGQNWPAYWNCVTFKFKL